MLLCFHFVDCSWHSKTLKCGRPSAVRCCPASERLKQRLTSTILINTWCWAAICAFWRLQGEVCDDDPVFPFHTVQNTGRDKCNHLVCVTLKGRVWLNGAVVSVWTLHESFCKAWRFKDSWHNRVLKVWYEPDTGLRSAHMYSRQTTGYIMGSLPGHVFYPPNIKQSTGILAADESRNDRNILTLYLPNVTMLLLDSLQPPIASNKDSWLRQQFI